MATEALANQTNGTSAVFNEMLPVDPFRSLYVHFGMLLGVDDFQTLDAYHRGKMWCHSAWLHGQGVIWGLQVALPENPIAEDDFDAEPSLDGEIKVVQAHLGHFEVPKIMKVEVSLCTEKGIRHPPVQDL